MWAESEWRGMEAPPSFWEGRKRFWWSCSQASSILSLLKNPDFPTGLQRWASGPPLPPSFSLVFRRLFGTLWAPANTRLACQRRRRPFERRRNCKSRPPCCISPLSLLAPPLLVPAEHFHHLRKRPQKGMFTHSSPLPFQSTLFFPACSWGGGVGGWGSWPRGHRPVCWSLKSRLQWAEPWGGGTPGSSFKCRVCAAGAPPAKVRENGFLVFSGVVGTPAGRVWSRRPQDNLGIIHFPLPRLSPAPVLR